MIIFEDSTFKTNELNAHFLFHSLLAHSSDLPPSPESDQKAASLPTDTSSDVSEVGRFALVINMKQVKTKIKRNRGAREDCFLNNRYISADETILVVSFFLNL